MDVPSVIPSVVASDVPFDTPPDVPSVVPSVAPSFVHQIFYQMHLLTYSLPPPYIAMAYPSFSIFICAILHCNRKNTILVDVRPSVMILQYSLIFVYLALQVLPLDFETYSLAMMSFYYFESDRGNLFVLFNVHVFQVKRRKYLNCSKLKHKNVIDLT